jgi:hypothetical protein
MTRSSRVSISVVKMNPLADGSCRAHETRRGMTPLLGLRLLSGLVVALMAIGCGPKRAAIPESPPEAMKAVVEGLGDNRPQVLWDALPATYQKDIREVISAFCTNMDPAIYDRGFRVLGKAVQVLKEKKDYLGKSPIALSTPLLESFMGSQWNDTVGLLDAIVQSDFSTLAALKQADPGKVLASTGHQVMAGLDTLRTQMQRSPGLNQWEKMSRDLKAAQVRFEKADETHGLLKITSSTNSALKDVELTRVEGRWVPSDMASSWKGKIAEGIERMAKLSGPEFAKAKPIVSMVLGTLEGSMDSLLRASSQEEFDRKLGELAAVGTLLKSLQKGGGK